MSYIAIEGVIAAGKTTFIAAFEAFCEARGISIKIIKEPIEPEALSIFYKFKDLGITSNNSHTELYQHVRDCVFGTFQHYMYTSRAKLLSKHLPFAPETIYLSERSLWADKEIFCKNNIRGDTEISKLTRMAYDSMTEAFDLPMPQKIIYLRPDIDVCMQRYVKRAREGEVVSFDYQSELYNNYERAIGEFDQSRLFVISGVSANSEFTDELMQKTLDFILTQDTPPCLGMYDDINLNSSLKLE